ncbi:MAG: DUF1007 family protein, partial [Mesorhizobium sp.]
MRLTGRISGVALLFASTVAAGAHPHVFAEARLDLTVGADRSVKS